MKLEIFTTNKKTILSKSTRIGLFSAFLLLFTFGQAQAQCPLGCNNNVQISLDGDCEVEVTPDMVLEGQGGASCDYTVVVLGSNNQPIIGSPVVTGAYIGQTLTVEIHLGNNSCWGYITLEDKLAPEIECPDDMTVSCYESSDFPKPIASDNCDNNVFVDVISDETVDLDCNDEYSAKRTIIYQATDDSGNKSEFCTKCIYFERIGIDSIDFPLNRDNVQLDALECGVEDQDFPDWDVNKNNYPDVEESGTPTTKDGHSIYPNNSYCELNVTYSDQRLDICESSFKILRNWIILDWCTGEIREQYQIVKVLDDQEPILTCPEGFIEYNEDGDFIGRGIDADPYTCTADWDVVAPNIIFDCSSTTHTVAFLKADNNGDAPVNGIYITDDGQTRVVTNADGSQKIENLPLGRTWIRYTVIDACGNVTRCFTEIDVVDHVPPVPVCDQHTVVTLTTNGWARIFAETFDDGSHDNCSDVTLEVRRMTTPVACRIDDGLGNNAWRGFTDFCCDDVKLDNDGNPIPVMVALRVTDEAGNSNTCMVEVIVQDKLKPTITCPPNLVRDCGFDYLDFDLTGYATGTDNCGPPTITWDDFGSLGDCGTGTITRVWKATDGGGLFVTCPQTIRIIDDSPFNEYGNEIGWPSDKLSLVGCEDGLDTDPSSTGTPTYSGDYCSLIADTYEDQVFTFVDDACFKILRTWTVIDWCQFDQNHPYEGGIWQHTQIIKVNNSVAPEFTNCPAVKNVEAFGENCNEFVELIGAATDECTPEAELVYSYELDLGNDGSIDIKKDDALGQDGQDASRTLDVGDHKITWTVEDMCGNRTICMQIIRVRDKKKPTPYCLSEITTVVMPDLEIPVIEIWASDFNLNSTDNCPGTLSYSFTSDVNDKNMKFYCDDVGVQILDIWVTDAAGNQDYCTTQINIQANAGCTGSRIAGNVQVETLEAVEDVTVVLENMSSHETVEFTTPSSGHYQFLNMTGGVDYEVTAKKDDDYRNGVNTIDVVKIQRHILGLEILDSPYKLIAADANNDGRIKPSDLLAVRKLILGVTAEFPKNDSWRFVDASQLFADPLDPFPFAEAISIEQFTSSDMGNHFMAVKIGDVDRTAKTSNLDGDNEVESRDARTFTMAVANAEYSTGDLVSIPVTAANASEIVGMQFTLESDGLLFESLDGRAMDMDDSNINTINTDNLAISWNDVIAKSFQQDEVLFVLNYRAKTSGTLENNIKLTSSATNAEAYTTSLETVDVEISFRSDKEEATVAFDLKQNSPNPFAEQTTISFTLPKAGEATLRVYDITGKVVSQYQSAYSRGHHEINIDATKFQATGVMYYQLEFDGQVATKKMISLGK